MPSGKNQWTSDVGCSVRALPFGVRVGVRGRLKTGRSMSNQRRGDAKGWLSHERPGYDCRVDELSAALGVTCMSRFVDVIWGGDETGGDEFSWS